MDLFNIRKNYTKDSLDINNLNANPIVQIEQWLEIAAQEKCLEHSAIILSTASADGAPSSRVVLLKKIDDEGLYFFTNYNSRKGQQIEENNKGAMLLFWPELERQINIEGTIDKCSTELSDFYFNSRPLESRISAVVSQQSKTATNKEAMNKSWRDALERNKNTAVIRPKEWGGYLLRPTRIEFWQGGANRFHDRILFEKENEEWKISRLMP